MKKSRINKLLISDKKRFRNIIIYIFFVINIFIIFIIFILLFFVSKKPVYVKYYENSDLDYKVYLKDNDFFDKPYLEANKEYIASLIDYIDANFKYNLKIDNDDYKYKYKYVIDVDVNVIEKNSGNIIYNNNIIIKEKEISYDDNDSSIDILENVKIDYNKYNDLISKFVKIYSLDNIDSYLNVNMKINVEGDCDLEGNNKESIITLKIPLTTKTMGIDMSYDLIDESEQKIISCTKVNRNSNIYLIISIILIVIDISLFIRTILYINRTRSAESIYDKKLKRILRSFGSYIEKINDDFNINGYQILRVDSFNDMLEIRDTIMQPILMVENDTKTGVYFIIPSTTKIIYSYGLKVADIKARLVERDNG